MKRPGLHRKVFESMWPRHKTNRLLPHKPRGSLAALTIGALGIVYGDIGTSPLYAMDALFFGRAGACCDDDVALGAQGDFCGLFGKADDDNGGIGRPSSHL